MKFFHIWDCGKVVEREHIEQLSSPYRPFTGIINLRSTYQPFTGIINLRSTYRPFTGIINLRSTIQPFTGIINLRLTYQPSTGIINLRSIYRSFTGGIINLRSTYQPFTGIINLTPTSRPLLSSTMIIWAATMMECWKRYGGNCNIEADTGRCRKRKTDRVRYSQIEDRYRIDKVNYSIEQIQRTQTDIGQIKAINHRKCRVNKGN